MLSPWTTYVKLHFSSRRFWECVTYYTTDCEEPDDDSDYLRQVSDIRTRFIAFIQRVQEFDRDVEIKDGRYSNGAKEAHEDGLLHLLDLGYEAVDGEDEGQAPQEKNQDAERDEAVDGDHIVVEELVPRDDGAVPHKDGDVQEHVNRWLEGVVFGFQAEPVVPRKSVACDEAREHVIAANHAARTDDEERQGDCKDQEALPVDVFTLLGPSEQCLCEPSHNGAVDDAEDDGIAPGLAEPQTHRQASASRDLLAAVANVLDQVEGEEQERISQPIVGAGLADDEIL